MEEGADSPWELLTRLAVGAVEVQRAFDEVARRCPPRPDLANGDLPATLVPVTALRLMSQRIETEVSLARSKRVGGEIRVGLSPTLGVPLAHHYISEATRRRSRVVIHVAAVPPPVAASDATSRSASPSTPTP